MLRRSSLYERLKGPLADGQLSENFCSRAEGLKQSADPGRKKMKKVVS